MLVLLGIGNAWLLSCGLERKAAAIEMLTSEKARGVGTKIWDKGSCGLS